MAELHEISLEIGALKAQVGEGNRQREAQFRKLDAIDDKLSRLSGQITLLTDQIMTIRKELDDDIRPTIASFKTDRAKALGILFAIGALGGGAAEVFRRMAGIQ